MVQKCVEFFTSHGEFEKSIELLVKVGKVTCLMLCAVIRSFITDVSFASCIPRSHTHTYTPHTHTQHMAWGV